MNKQVVIWFSIVMIILTMSGAILFTFTETMSDRLFGSKRTMFIFVLGGYSIYRSIRLKFLLKKNTDS